MWHGGTILPYRMMLNLLTLNVPLLDTLLWSMSHSFSSPSLCQYARRVTSVP